MTKVEQWIAAKIDECAPSSGAQGARAHAAVEDLLRALLFFDGKASQIFGMSADRSTMPEGTVLRTACASAIRGWFDVLGKRDVAAQVNLFEVATRHGLSLDLPEPPSVTTVRSLERERSRMLAEYGNPSSLLPARAREDLCELRAVGNDVPFRSIAKYVKLECSRDMSRFEWLSDRWLDVAGAELEPAFLPIAGADGDYLGLVLDTDLLREHQAPLVYYFHEHDPAYTWVSESCASAVHILKAILGKRSRKTISRGTEHRSVTAFLRALNDIPGNAQRSGRAEDVSTRTMSRRWMWDGPLNGEAAAVFERAENAFAIRNIAAQRTWREFEAKIRAARASLATVAPVG